MSAIRARYVVPGVVALAVTATIPLVNDSGGGAQATRSGAHESAKVQAAGKAGSAPYEVVKTWRSKPLKRCVKMTLKGQIAWTNLPSESGIYKNPRLRSPNMMIETSACGGAKKATITGAQLIQQWYDEKCTVSPSVTFSIPWSLGVAISRACGRVQTAKADTRYYTKAEPARYFEQDNAGLTPVVWKRQGQFAQRVVSHWEKVPLCLGVSTTVTIQLGTKSDTWEARNLKTCTVQ